MPTGRRIDTLGVVTGMESASHTRCTTSRKKPVYLKYPSRPMLKTMPASIASFLCFFSGSAVMMRPHAYVTTVHAAISSAYSACQFM